MSVKIDKQCLIIEIQNGDAEYLEAITGAIVDLIGVANSDMVGEMTIFYASTLLREMLPDPLQLQHGFERAILKEQALQLEVSTNELAEQKAFNQQIRNELDAEQKREQVINANPEIAYQMV